MEGGTHQFPEEQTRCKECGRYYPDREALAQHMLLDHVDLRKKPDMIDHPPHYTWCEIEPIDVIEDWRLGFNLGQVVKYVARHDHKGDALSDLKKALWYLQREVANREAADDEARTGS